MPTLQTGSAAVTTGASAATTLSFTVPSGTAVGDIIVIWCFSATSSRTFSATGYTAAAASNPGSATISAGVLYKTAVSGDLGGSVTVTISGSASDWGGLVFAVSSTAGFDPTPSDGGQVNTASVTITVPGQTTTLGSDLIVWPAGTRSGAAGGVPGTITIPSGFTGQVSQADTTNSGATNVGVILATGTAGSAGATGNENGSVSASQANGGMVLCFGDSSGSTPVSGADTGSGADTATLAAAAAGADTGSGADLAGVGVTGTDSGSAADTATVVVPVTGTDTGSGADTASVAAALTGTDTATGAGVAQVGVTGADTGSGADTASVGVPIAAADTAAGADSASVHVAVTGTDAASGTDTGSSSGPPACRADTDGSALHGSITASVTSWPVTSTVPGAPLWTTDAAQFPFDIIISGERVTVTAITGTSSPQTFTGKRSVNGVVKAHAAGEAVALFSPCYFALA